MPLLPGTRLGPYQIVAAIGAGGMGEVYRARDSPLDRDVAIKVLPEQLAGDPQALARFEREAKAIAALSHPNIMAIYDVGEEQGVHYAVMELLEGQTLRARLRNGALGWEPAAELGAALAEGLAAAHSKSVIHRDLKPDNVFLTLDGRVKVLDFGLARVAAETAKAADATVTQAGVIMGTIGYMSPEQVRGEPAGPPSDIFALGCVLYEIVAGRRAFHGNTPAETMSSILRDAPADLRASMRGVPAELERAIARCLEKNPRDRFASASDLAQHLKATLKSGGHPPAETPKAPNSIAVLPFTNASRDPDAEYLSDGLTESIINSLTRLSQVKVLPRSTVFRHKAQDADPQAIGQTLHVRVVLTGRVMQRGESLVVSAELIDVAEGTQLWGERYNRKMADVFELEEEIARKISDALRVQLTGDEEKLLAKRHTQDSEAYRLYLKGRYHWVKRTPEHMLKAAEYFQQAIDRDPAYALAYAGMADCHSVMATWVFAPPRDAWARAKAAAAAALALDPELGEAHVAVGFIKAFHDWDWQAGEQEILRGIELNPSNSVAHYWYTLLLVALGRSEEAERQYAIALATEPLSPVVLFCGLLAAVTRRRWEEAIERGLVATEIDPTHPLIRGWLSLAYEMTGRLDEAQPHAQAWGRLLNGACLSHGVMAYFLARQGQLDEAKQSLQEALARAAEGLAEPLSLALAYVGLGETNKVLEWIEWTFEHRCGLLVFVIKTDIRFDPFRGEPRFQAALERMGLA